MGFLLCQGNDFGVCVGWGGEGAGCVFFLIMTRSLWKC